MSAAAVTAGGWLVALALAAGWRVVLARRMELVARACHELRGPLTAARLAARFAARAEDPAEARGPLEAVDLELGRARLALDDLQAARTGGRADDRAYALDAGTLLVEVAEAWRPLAREHGVRLRVEPPPGPARVHGDRDRLAQACGNLVANAIEHGGDDREVVIRARSGLHTVRIEVLDEGPGLPAPVAVLVRRPRAGRGSRGRGLAIAADVAARHRGRLAAAPADRGARLVLELPSAV